MHCIFIQVASYHNFYFFHQMINLENIDKIERLIVWMCSTYVYDVGNSEALAHC